MTSAKNARTSRAVGDRERIFRSLPCMEKASLLCSRFAEERQFPLQSSDPFPRRENRWHSQGHRVHTANLEPLHFSASYTSCLDEPDMKRAGSGGSAERRPTAEERAFYRSTAASAKCGNQTVRAGKSSPAQIVPDGSPAFAAGVASSSSSRSPIASPFSSFIGRPFGGARTDAAFGSTGEMALVPFRDAGGGQKASRASLRNNVGGKAAAAAGEGGTRRSADAVVGTAKPGATPTAAASATASCFVFEHLCWKFIALFAEFLVPITAAVIAVLALPGSGIFCGEELELLGTTNRNDLGCATLTLNGKKTGIVDVLLFVVCAGLAKLVFQHLGVAVATRTEAILPPTAGSLRIT